MAEHGGQPPYGISNGEYQAALTRQFTYSEEASGPIPPPAMMRMYAEIDPTFPERLMSMAERDQESRIENVKNLASAEATAVRLGSWAGAIVTVLSLVAAVVLTLLGHTGVALLAAIPAVLTGGAKIVEAARTSKRSD